MYMGLKLAQRESVELGGEKGQKAECRRGGENKRAVGGAGEVAALLLVCVCLESLYKGTNPIQEAPPLLFLWPYHRPKALLFNTITLGQRRGTSP